MAKEFKSFVFPETTKKQIDAMPVEMKLRFYDAVTNYGMYGIEPEDLSQIEYLIWIPMKDLIDNCRKSHGGAPVGNNNARKNDETTKTTQNNQNNVDLLKTTETTFINDNHNDNHNDNLNGEGEIEPAFLSPQPETYAKEIFDVLVKNDLPCCNKNFLSFLQRDFKNALETIHGTINHLHSSEVIEAVKNYAAVVNHPQTWHGWKSKKTFDRFVSWERFKDFLPGNFCLDNFLEHAEKKETKEVGKDKAMRIMEEMGIK